MGSENITVAKLAKTIATTLPEGAATTYVHSEEIFPEHKVSFEKFKNHIGFEPRISIDQGIMELYIALKGKRVEPTINTHTQKVYAELIKTGVDGTIERYNQNR